MLSTRALTYAVVAAMFLAPCAVADSHVALAPSPGLAGCGQAGVSGQAPFFPPPPCFGPPAMMPPPNYGVGGMMPPPMPGFPFGGPPPPGGPSFLMVLPLGGLGLSDQQIEAMAGLKRTFHDNSEPIRLKMRQLEEAVQHELTQDNVDADTIKKLTDRLIEQRNLLDNLANEYVLKTAQLLSPEQRKAIRRAADRMSLGPMAFDGPPRALH